MEVDVGTRGSGRASRYAGLASLFELDAETVEVTFSEIEDAIGGELPASARRHRAWWANSETNSQARAWMRQGYRLRDVDVAGGVVTFERA